MFHGLMNNPVLVADRKAFVGRLCSYALCLYFRGMLLLFCSDICSRWHALALLVEALCYKPVGRGFESQGSGFFQLT
jgi:hypothetical protein